METSQPSDRLFRLGNLTVDLEGYRAAFAGRLLRLSPTQLEVLATLLGNRGRVVSRAEFSAVTGLQYGRSVDVILSNLRKEVGCEFIRNVRGRGWTVVPEMLED